MCVCARMCVCEHSLRTSCSVRFCYITIILIVIGSVCWCNISLCIYLYSFYLSPNDYICVKCADLSEHFLFYTSSDHAFNFVFVCLLLCSRNNTVRPPLCNHRQQEMMASDKILYGFLSSQQILFCIVVFKTPSDCLSVFQHHVVVWFHLLLTITQSCMVSCSSFSYIPFQHHTVQHTLWLFFNTVLFFPLASCYYFCTQWHNHMASYIYIFIYYIYIYPSSLILFNTHCNCSPVPCCPFLSFHIIITTARNDNIVTCGFIYHQCHIVQYTLWPFSRTCCRLVSYYWYCVILGKRTGWSCEGDGTRSMREEKKHVLCLCPLSVFHCIVSCVAALWCWSTPHPAVWRTGWKETSTTYSTHGQHSIGQKTSRNCDFWQICRCKKKLTTERNVCVCQVFRAVQALGFIPVHYMLQFIF